MFLDHRRFVFVREVGKSAVLTVFPGSAWLNPGPIKADDVAPFWSLPALGTNKRESGSQTFRPIIWKKLYRDWDFLSAVNSDLESNFQQRLTTRIPHFLVLFGRQRQTHSEWGISPLVSTI